MPTREKEKLVMIHSNHMPLEINFYHYNFIQKLILVNIASNFLQ